MSCIQAPRRRRAFTLASGPGVAEFTGLTAECTLREAARISYFDPRRLFRADGTLVPIVELGEDAAGMIAAIEVDEDGRTTRLHMWDKNAALEKALKHLDLYERDNRQKAENLTLQVLLVQPGQT
jgi:phage terminase small subunit